MLHIMLKSITRLIKRHAIVQNLIGHPAHPIAAIAVTIAHHRQAHRAVVRRHRQAHPVVIHPPVNRIIQITTVPSA